MVIKGPWELELFRLLTMICLHEPTRVINCSEPTHMQVSVGKTADSEQKCENL